MTDLGLNRRLRQRSRRAGVMIGVSMALTIALCVTGFSVIYASLDDVLGDFVSRDQSVAATVEPAGGTEIAAQQSTDPTAPPEDPDQPAPTPTPTPQPSPPPTDPPASPTEVAFQPDFQTSNQYSLNLRSQPSSVGGESEVVAVLPPSTPLQYQNEDAPTQNPQQDGDRWMRFLTEEGDEGWIRELDVEPYQP